MVADRDNNDQSSSVGALPAWNTGVGGSPRGFQQLTAGDLASATGLIVPDGAHLAVITVEAGVVRWRDDGVAPDANTGVTFSSTQAIPVMTYSASLGDLMFIASSGSPILNCSFYA